MTPRSWPRTSSSLGTVTPAQKSAVRTSAMVAAAFALTGVRFFMSSRDLGLQPRP